MSKHENNALQLLLDLLAIPSVNGRDREGAVAEYLNAYFQAYGVESIVQPIDAMHSNIIAFLPGADASRTHVWNGHLDTVPYGDLAAWSSDPSAPAIRGGKLYARGASDMKSGLAAMVYALCHLEQPPSCNIRFLGTCDEEKDGLGAETALQAGYVEDASFLLVGEPTALRPGTAQKGCLWLEMRLQGRTSHGAYPEQGVNAVECGVRIAQALATYIQSFTHPLLGSSTAQITGIEGGVASNMTPDQCRIVMDIRMVPPLSADDVLAKAEEALAAEQTIHPGLSAAWHCLNNRRAIEIERSHPAVAALRNASRKRNPDLDLSPIGINFFTDASILDRNGAKDILLFGPGDPALAHQPDEYVEIEKYLDAVAIFREMALM